ncbi:hypothetical protein CCR75_008894 [Bremia lactucae]|uniref:PH domain-containing protein n=1 Tax=Bremia lactucae TaxID=4779 RepID=A0A976NZK9_BRELC|nr:hypothetical protein CCR75_008894 [Bremia lactucae]
MPTLAPRRLKQWRVTSHASIRSESNGPEQDEAAPESNLSSYRLASTTTDKAETLNNEKPVLTPVQKSEGTEKAPVKLRSSAGFAAYCSFSARKYKAVHDETEGLSGFLEYRKLNGLWRPFLFQTTGHQLMLYRIHSTHQVLIMTTDIHCASKIALDEENSESTRLLRLEINGTLITLRAVTHAAALYWVTGLRRLRDGKRLQILKKSPCKEPEDKIFEEIDQILLDRECPPSPPPAPLCGLCNMYRKSKHSTSGMILSRLLTL